MVGADSVAHTKHLASFGLCHHVPNNTHNHHSLPLLYIYGFAKVEGSLSKGTFSHPMFVRGNRALSMRMGRNRLGDRRKKNRGGPEGAGGMSPSSGGGARGPAAPRPAGPSNAAAPAAAGPFQTFPGTTGCPPLLRPHDVADAHHALRGGLALPPLLPDFHKRPTSQNTAVCGPSSSPSSSLLLPSSLQQTMWECMVRNGPSDTKAGTGGAADFKRYLMTPMFQGLDGPLPAAQTGLPPTPPPLSVAGTSPVGGGGTGHFLGATADDGDNCWKPWPPLPPVVAAAVPPQGRHSPQQLPSPYYWTEEDHHGGWDLEPRPIEAMVAERESRRIRSTYVSFGFTAN
jgi:hypothetical protein